LSDWLSSFLIALSEGLLATCLMVKILPVSIHPLLLLGTFVSSHFWGFVVNKHLRFMNETKTKNKLTAALLWSAFPIVVMFLRKIQGANIVELALSFIVLLALSGRGVSMAVGDHLSYRKQLALVWGTVCLSVLALIDSPSLLEPKCLVMYITIYTIAIMRRCRLELIGLSKDSGKAWKAGSAIFLFFIVFTAMILVFWTTSLSQIVLLALSLIWNVIVKILGYLLIPIGYITHAMVRFLRLIIGNREFIPNESPLTAIGEWTRTLPHKDNFTQLPSWMTWVFWTVFVLAASKLIWTLFMGTQRATSVDNDGTVRTSLLQEGALDQWIYDVRTGLTSMVTDTMDRLMTMFWKKDLVTVDDVYHQLLALLAAKGHPRLPHMTPQEYMASVSDILATPTIVDDVRLVTKTFVQCHYSGKPPSSDEISSVKEAYIRIRASGTLFLEESHSHSAR
jgi:hypothetical protein